LQFVLLPLALSAKTIVATAHQVGLEQSFYVLVKYCIVGASTSKPHPIGSLQEIALNDIKPFYEAIRNQVYILGSSANFILVRSKVSVVVVVVVVVVVLFFPEVWGYTGNGPSTIICLSQVAQLL